MKRCKVARRDKDTPIEHLLGKIQPQIHLGQGAYEHQNQSTYQTGNGQFQRDDLDVFLKH